MQETKVGSTATAAAKGSCRGMPAEKRRASALRLAAMEKSAISARKRSVCGLNMRCGDGVDAADGVGAGDVTDALDCADTLDDVDCANVSDCADDGDDAAGARRWASDDCPRRLAASLQRLVAVPPSRHWCVTSRPTMVMSAPEWNTRSAASGSWIIFVSAVRSQQLPSWVREPPIITRRRFRVMSGASAIAMSMSVSGPVATTVTSLPNLRIWSMRNRTPSGMSPSSSMSALPAVPLVSTSPSAAKEKEKSSIEGLAWMS